MIIAPPGRGGAIAPFLWAQASRRTPTAGRSSRIIFLRSEEAIVITAPYVARSEPPGLTATCGGLVRDMRSQLGETLARLPGVSATSFGPGASRPVLRGFQGERVRVLVDGIGSIDVSNTSADHAVTIDPITSDRIEVLHGPAVLLFGSQAIGGAVNVFDRRIPRRVPDDAVHIDRVQGKAHGVDGSLVGRDLVALAHPSSGC